MNRQIRLAAHPDGMVRDSDFEHVVAPVPEPDEGEALVRNLYLSIDPAIRGWMNGADTYVPGIHAGDVMRSAGIGEVVESRNPRYNPGDRVLGFVGWQDWSIVDSEERSVEVIPPVDPATAFLSVYGVTGVTAYFGMLDVAQPQPGEMVVVSGAAGAVGSVAGQIAKIRGCDVVGTAGSDAKCAWITDELGFDAAINYKTEDLGAALSRTCPEGIDVYFDNVGGEMLDLVLERINNRARIALCGSISQYNATKLPPGPRNLVQLIPKRGRMEGFIVLDYLPRFLEAILQLGEWVAAGKLKYAEEIVDGLDGAPGALQRLFTGDHTGKLIVRVGGA